MPASRCGVCATAAGRCSILSGGSPRRADLPGYAAQLIATIARLRRAFADSGLAPDHFVFGEADHRAYGPGNWGMSDDSTTACTDRGVLAPNSDGFRGRVYDRKGFDNGRLYCLRTYYLFDRSRGISRKIFFPQALAHKFTGGRIIGIDPYRKDTAREKDVSLEMRAEIDKFIDSWDIVGSYIAVLEKISDLKLGNNATIFRETSEGSFQYIPNGIGMIHIDGNHDTDFVLNDITNYFGKIKHNGIVIMDDTDWASVRGCLHLLSEGCILEKDYNTW